MKRPIALVITLCALVTAGVAAAAEQSTLLTSRGLVEFHAGRFAEALEHFDRAVEADPEDVYARYYRAVTRGRLGNFADAISDLRVVVAAKPDLSQAALELGVALVQTAQYDEAVPWLARAQWDAELEAQASLFLGLARLRLGQLAGARENFERAAAKDKQLDRAAQYYEGVIDYQEGNWSRAKEHFTFVTGSSPDSDMGREAATFLEKMRQGEGPAYQVYGTVGFQYDSNVQLAPSNSVIKQATGITKQSDGRATIAAGGTYMPWQTERMQLLVGYDFFQSLHFDLTDFNLQDHGPSLQLIGDAGPVHFGLLGRYDYYLLESNSFLQEGNVLPWVTIADSQVGRTELSYRMRRRDFKKHEFIIRDAFNHATGVRQYFYLGSADRYLSVGYQYDRDDPVVSGKLVRELLFAEKDANGFAKDANGFAYDGNEVNGAFGWTFPAEVTAELTYAYRNELYAEESEEFGTPEVPIPPGKRRVDHEHQIIISVRKLLSDHLSITAAYLADINNSNNGLFDYNRHIGSLALEARF